jgi:hypothetical protein
MVDEVALIVEGQGDVEAAPILIRRIASDHYGRHDLRMRSRPFRVRRGRFSSRFDDLENAVSFLSNAAKSIIIVLDSDDDDPQQLRTGLETRAAVVASHVNTLVCPAVREYEAWFLASLGSMSGSLGVKAGLPSEPNCEEPRGAKGRFQGFLESGTYSETVDQPRFTRAIDIEEAMRNSGSFRELVAAVGRVLQP